MKFKSYLIVLTIASFILALSRCQPDQKITETLDAQLVGTPYELEIPYGFPQPDIPDDNPLTVEGIKLGRFLFYEKKLSGDLTQSCGSCHMQDNSLSDTKAKSIGIDGFETDRHAMVLFNLAWQEFFFWDGRAMSLEEQALEPVTNPIELNTSWDTVIARLQATPMYANLFTDAFGDDNVTIDRVTKAIAQFERTIISANSHYDSIKRMTAPSAGSVSLNQFTDPLIKEGYAMFSSEVGDCFHCHGEIETSYLLGAFGKDNTFKNNGLKSEWIDELGRAEVVPGDENIGLMKVPTLRNINYSAPYMHDGSIPTLDSLVRFYNFGGHLTSTSNVDPNMKAAGIGRNWSEDQMDALEAFLRSLSDFKFLTDTNYSDPFIE